MAVSPWVCLLVLSCWSVSCYADVVRAEFQSCPACRLNSLPQVKRFLFKVVSKGVYPNVSVKWMHGRTPELVLYDETGAEVERMFVDKLTFNDLHTLLQQKGFKANSGAVDEEETSSKDKPQLATVLQQPTNHDSASEASSLSATSTSRRSLSGKRAGASLLGSLTVSRSLDLDA